MLTQIEIHDLAKSYAAGRIAEWMILDACDDDLVSFQRVIEYSKNFGPSDGESEAIEGLI